MAGKRIILASGKYGVGSGGKAAITDGSGACPECCGAECSTDCTDCASTCDSTAPTMSVTTDAVGCTGGGSDCTFTTGTVAMTRISSCYWEGEIGDSMSGPYTKVTIQCVSNAWAVTIEDLNGICRYTEFDVCLVCSSGHPTGTVVITPSGAFSCTSGTFTLVFT